MTSTKSNEKFSIAAAVCFSLLAVGIVVYNIIYPPYGYVKIHFRDFLAPTIAIGFAISLFLKNKLAVTIVSVINTLFHLFFRGSGYFVGFRSYKFYSFYTFAIADFLYFLACVAVVAVLVMALKENPITKKIWFIGGALLLIDTALTYGSVLLLDISNHTFHLFYDSSNAYMLSQFVNCIAFLFIGLWLKGYDYPAKTVPMNEYPIFNPQLYNTAYSCSRLGTRSERIAVKGTPQNNKLSRILIKAGMVLILMSFIIYTFLYFSENDMLHEVFRYIHIKYIIPQEAPGIRDNFFGMSFVHNFFNIRFCYGYILLLGVITLVAGFLIKFSTENCEITVAESRIFGKISHGKNVDIPINQVTALHPCAFNGISVASIGNVSNFYCIENHEEVMKAISYLLTNPQSASLTTHTGEAATTGSLHSETDSLKQIKELLDSGIISQEEFDAKKKEILKL